MFVLLFVLLPSHSHTGWKIWPSVRQYWLNCCTRHMPTLVLWLRHAILIKMLSKLGFDLDFFRHSDDDGDDDYYSYFFFFSYALRFRCQDYDRAWLFSSVYSIFYPRLSRLCYVESVSCFFFCVESINEERVHIDNDGNKQNVWLGRHTVYSTQLIAIVAGVIIIETYAQYFRVFKANFVVDDPHIAVKLEERK